MGNLGPVADAKGRVQIAIRDLDQTVIGNPAHDLIRLGLSLATAIRSSDLPGVTTSIEIPVGSNSYPTLTVHWDEPAFGLTVAQCVEELAAGTPRIEALSTLGNRSLLPPRVRRSRSPSSG